MLAAAEGSSWQVWRGNQVALCRLAEGVFVQGDLSACGPEGAAFVRGQLPLLNVPWRVKAALEAAGVTECKELTPPVLRLPLADPSQLQDFFHDVNQGTVGRV